MMVPGDVAPEQDEPHMGTVSQMMGDLASARERIRALELLLDEAREAGAEARSQSGERLRMLLGNLQELILVVNADRLITDVAGNCMGLLGYAAIELCGPGVDLDVVQLFDGRDRTLVEAQIAEARLHPQGSAIAVRIADRAGEMRWVECTLVPLYEETEQQYTGLQVILRDVSERVHAEQIMHSLNEASAAVQRASLSLDGVLDVVTEQLHALDLNSAVGLWNAQTGQVEWVKIRGESRYLQAMDKLAAEVPGLTLDNALQASGVLRAGQPTILRLDQAIIAQPRPQPDCRSPGRSATRPNNAGHGASVGRGARLGLSRSSCAVAR